MKFSPFSLRYKPRARPMALLCVLGTLAGVAGFVAVTLTRCPPLKIDGPVGGGTQTGDALYGDCAQGCNCDEVG